MKLNPTVALLLLSTVLFSCKSATEVTTPLNGSVRETLVVLRAARTKFVEFAKTNPGRSPGEVLIQTTEWVKKQPNVVDAYWFDSTYLEIKMKSGQRMTFMLFRAGDDGMSVTRGGTPVLPASGPTPVTRSANVIANKNVLIYAPFVGTNVGDLYHEGDLDMIINQIKNSGKDMKVTYHEYSEATLKDVESFGDYGLVILDTHGKPDAFLTGQFIIYNPEIDTSEAAIKEQMDYTLGPGGYEKVSSGDLHFCHGENIPNEKNWETFLTGTGDNRYRIVLDAAYLNSLPQMPNTVILANMCYSGWNAAGEFSTSQRGKTEVNDPIETAFLNRGLISYYSYGYADGTSAAVDNNFCKRMEDSLIRALLYDGDSTGNAYLNASGTEFTGQQLGEKINPDLPFTHTGHDDYSYEGCVSEFTDARDGQKYKAVCIGKQNWMAENLRYVTSGSMYYNDSSVLGPAYGRLYTWSELMGGFPSSNTNPSGVQGLCPKGWHIPSLAEWEQLITFIGGTKAGANLKAIGNWIAPNNGATDKYGFKGLGGGMYYPDSNTCYFLNQEGHWWASTISSDPNSSYHAVLTTYSRDIFMNGVTIDGNDRQKKSCRCLKD